jgi:hypothetical protein
MSGFDDGNLPDHLAEVAETVRRHGPEATPLQLDAIKRRALTRAARPHRGKGPLMRAKLLILMLAAGLALSGGAAGVIAATGGSGDQSALSSEYSCNSGRGNGSELCDPGNSSDTPGGGTGQNQGGDEGGPVSGGTGTP